MPKPPGVAEIERTLPEAVAHLRSLPPGERRSAANRLREQGQAVSRELAIEWLRHARQPAVSAQEKWVLFLSDLYVVGAEKVRNPALLHQYTELLRTLGYGRAPDLTKAVSRAPAMIEYLDLQQSRRGAPNENFVRELFELFVLGEGHYSEQDIQEAARAFTGYRQEFGTFRRQTRQIDSSPKTVFGVTRAFDGDDIIDLAYAQPAAATVLPREFLRFYVSSEPLPGNYVEELGRLWREDDFSLAALLRRVFRSRLFFSAPVRGNLIKSPIQFYLGVLQHLDLDVAPFPRAALFALRQMGQIPFYPPNVRGWVGGKAWINATTLAARRQVIQTAFSPWNEDALNADEQRALAAARERKGRVQLRVPAALLDGWSRTPPEQLVDQLTGTWLARDPGPEFKRRLVDFLVSRRAAPSAGTVAMVATLLQTPEYQLC